MAQANSEADIFQNYLGKLEHEVLAPVSLTETLNHVAPGFLGVKKGRESDKNTIEGSDSLSQVAINRMLLSG